MEKGGNGDDITIIIRKYAKKSIKESKSKTILSILTIMLILRMQEFPPIIPDQLLLLIQLQRIRMLGVMKQKKSRCHIWI